MDICLSTVCSGNTEDAFCKSHAVFALQISWGPLSESWRIWKREILVQTAYKNSERFFKEIKLLQIKRKHHKQKSNKIWETT